jgi:hypothetical protein
MKAFTTLAAVAAPFDMANIDIDCHPGTFPAKRSP